MSFPASAPDAGFLRTLAADPASPAAWTGLGDARRERGLWVAAVVAAERAVRLAPQDGTALTALALARLAAQDSPGALDAAGRAAAAAPRSPAARRASALAFLRAGRLDDAEREAAAGLGLDPAYPEGTAALALVRMMQGRLVEADRHPRVRLILEDRPQGKGHAVRTGLAAATGDFILIQDADLEYSLDDYEKLLEPLLRGEVGFVLGSRHAGDAAHWNLRHFANQKHISQVMNIGHFVFATLLNVMYGQNLKDPFTMYKVFRRDCLDGLTFECNRFDFDWELVIKLIRVGFTPIEIPVTYHSRSFEDGKKVSLFGDPLSWIVACFKYRFAKVES